MSRTPPVPLPRLPAPSQDGGKAGGRPNSLGLNAKQLDAIMLRADGHGGIKPDRRRRFVRWPYRQPSLDLHIAQPGGSTNNCRVACRNLSCGGMSLVHSAFIYPGSPCVAFLPRPGGRGTPVQGVVVRCADVSGMVHEIGIRFNTNIAVGEYADNDPMAGQFSLEIVEPEALVGTLLCVEDSTLDQKLIQHYLRGTSVRIRIAQSASQAGTIASEGCDIVVCDYHLGTQGAEAVVTAVRDALPEVPVIIVTADSAPETLERIRRMPVNAFLSKPFTDTLLQRAMGEFLIARLERGVDGRGNAPAGGGEGVLPSEVLRDLADYKVKLETAVRDADPTACYVMCQQIGATALVARRHTLARLAQEASSSLAATMDLAEASRQVKEVIAACTKLAA